MKKFITVIPLQVQGQLRRYHYQAVDNSRLQMDGPTSFPILAAVNGYVQPGEKFRLLAIAADSEDGRRNCAVLQGELEELCRTKGCPCPQIETIPAPADEGVAAQIAAFQRLIACVEDDDELFVCVTYGTKLLSQVTLMAVQYAYQAKKNTSISCVVYGQIDAAGDRSRSGGRRGSTTRRPCSSWGRSYAFWCSGERRTPERPWTRSSPCKGGRRPCGINKKRRA